jgi:hypothetical protein
MRKLVLLEQRALLTQDQISASAFCRFGEECCDHLVIVEGG